ncbi:2-hydroxyacid dehydrogenase [Psychrosphaera sp. B3R10]|uniref:2-hydroxyacid dehydrogenase n=1 Tax=Psychrosphaera algicola TaxID=3023714 RepID=A0ABT5FAL3_9GAMM|nr:MULTISPECIES: 2-hydroxyacid dehydrogenase [unclassified Psychrosphaera]MBU2882804.1 2-hydroxyacid dehydrogenase [Psychrosphaera sp. I2R16]MBU2988046.1 2-hydroxyacid dehydrogenase [Psychrosphaera sp. B3R10]MDC2888169.1 2-hydroxyacid dehydrogenase [Psychrosphaera sp. G1-22]MDO6721066.1 2-hydroxyacid dehydrogenase [Psychrosphaera sp. 1_MG-2023]
MSKFTVAVFSSKPYDNQSLLQCTTDDIEFQFFETRLTEASVLMAQGVDAVCVFVNDILNREVLTQLKNMGINKIVLRCAGFNNVDLSAAKELEMSVARVPAYSPEAVAEHTIALLLTLNRKLHKAYNRIKDNNFSLTGLMGFNLSGKTVGIIGTGKIGVATTQILRGFKANVIAYDPNQSEEFKALGGEYVSIDVLYNQSDIISLHCPLSPTTHHLINDQALEKMKQNVMLINTSRGALIDTQSVIKHLKNKKIGYLALDVYEQESELFFEDHSFDILQDDTFQRLLTFPNVLITGHQGFFTAEALEQIASITISNINDLKANRPCINSL